MRPISFARFSALSLLIVFAMSAWAGPLEDGLAAHKKADFPAAIAILRPLATEGAAQAQIALGEMYEKGQGVSRDYAESVKWFQLASAQGAGAARYNLALAYEKGQGIKQDFTEALKLYRLVAESGYAPAEVNIGMLYANGQGVNKDDAEALKWFRQAALRGDPKAQTNVAFMYRNGRGVAKDSVEARKWFQLAAVQGYAEAQFGLGTLFINGDGGDKNLAEAFELSRLGAEQGSAEAQFRLGVMYSAGMGVTPDPVRGLMWLHLASAGGNPTAVNWRDRNVKLATSDQNSKALQLAGECKQRNFKGCSVQILTTDVSKYLKDSFNVGYVPIKDDMSCREDAPVPADKGNITAFVNCQESRKDGAYAGIGWKKNSVERDAGNKRFAATIRFSYLTGPDSDAAKDIVTCAQKTNGYSTERGDLIQCKVEFFGAKDSFKVAHFSVFYPKFKNNLGYDFFVGASDNFLGKPDLPTSIVLEYQARMSDLSVEAATSSAISK